MPGRVTLGWLDNASMAGNVLSTHVTQLFCSLGSKRFDDRNILQQVLR